MAVFELEHYVVRRKVLKLFGGTFFVRDVAGHTVATSRQQAFRLKEDIRVHDGDGDGPELLVIRARQVIDFAASYDIVDPAAGAAPLGTARRQGLRSILRDSWEVVDPAGAPLARLVEDSPSLALLRRFVGGLVPQHFHLDDAAGARQAVFRVAFNPFVYRLHVDLQPHATIDRRIVLAVAVLLTAIEGRQSD